MTEVVKPKPSITAGLIAGLLLGYPISYFFQSSALRAKVSLGGYVQNIGEVLKSPEFRATAIGVWLACIVIFPVIQRFLANRRGRASAGPS